MKTKCSTILKIMTSLLLAVLMMVGSVSNVVGAIIEQAEYSGSNTSFGSIVDTAKAEDGSAETEAADDAETAPDLSGFEENETVRGMKEDLAGTGADVDLSGTGYSGLIVRGSWDKTGEVWNNHDITSSPYSVTLTAGENYNLVFKAKDNDDEFATGTTISSGITNYNFPKSNKDVAITLHTTIAGVYTFSFNGFDGGQTAASVNITFPEDTTPDTWTVVGGFTEGSNSGGVSNPLFTKQWDPTLTQNDMTESSGTWTWSKSNVVISDASTIYYKVAKNHAWDTTIPSANKTEVTLDGSTRNTSTNKVPAGTYNVTVTSNGSNTVSISLTTITKSRLTVATNNDATVTATYGGTTVSNKNATNYIDNIPQEATVSISVTPVSGQKCTGVTGAYTGGGTVNGTGANSSWTLTMPAANTNVTVSLEPVTMKKIYFNNNYTQYGTVYAYVYDKNGTSKTYEYLGKRPGKVMIEPQNSEIWYIEVPNDVDYVEFISGDGKTTGELTIPWSNACPKYIAPNNYDAPTPTNGGTWGNYKWGDKHGDTRDNVYTVTNGSTMGASNLFTGISATLFDYYVDDEITGSWLTGTASNAANYDNTGLSSNDPYKKLNANLSAYADADKTSANADWANASQPKYGTTYPLYFGDLNVDAGDSLVSGYYDFVKKVNNSNALTKNNNALTGLSGNELGKDKTIHYYKSGADGENGAPMAMFNEDFLSGENKTGDTLATILRTASFPVRKETSVKTLCLDMSSHQGNWENDSAVIVANFHNGNTTSGNLRVLMTPYGGHKYYVEVPSGYSQVEWCRFNPNDDYTSADAWNYKNAEAFGTNNTYKFSSNYGNEVSGSWSTNSTLATGHDYYEYDSTKGKDNAYITDISTSKKTAEINYYDSASGKTVKSAEKNQKASSRLTIIIL